MISSYIHYGMLYKSRVLIISKLMNSVSQKGILSIKCLHD